MSNDRLFGTIEEFHPESGLGIVLLGLQRIPFHASALPKDFVPAIGEVVRFQRATWATHIVPEQERDV